MIWLGGRLWRDLDDVLEGPGCLVLVLLFLAFVTFLASLSRALGRVDPENRKMEPGQVWLNLLPVVNLVWLPVTVERLAWSLRDELRARGLDRHGDTHGRSTGHTGLVLGWVGALSLPVGVLFLFLALVYGIAYWVVVAGHAGRLTDDAPARRGPVDEGW